MKVVLIRTAGNVVNYSNYNLQEIGLAKALRRISVECDVIYFCGKEESYIQNIDYDNNNIKVYWVKGFSIAGNGFFYGLNKILENYDIIQVSEYDQLTSLYLAFYSKYRTKIVLYHGPYLCDYNKKYRTKCFFVDKLPLPKKEKRQIPCFAKSVYAKKFLNDRGFENIIVTGVGLDVDRFSGTYLLKPYVQDILRKINNRFVLLYIGQIAPRRNIDFMISVTNIIRQQIENVCLLMIGRGPKEYTENCQASIREMNLDNHILLVDCVEQDQLPFIYNNSSVFLLPTSYEIFGMVILESMYYSLPIITTDNGGARTALIDGENGFIRELNENEWVKLLGYLYDNQEMCEKIGENASMTIRGSFTWNQIAKKMKSVYMSRM